MASFAATVVLALGLMMALLSVATAEDDAEENFPSECRWRGPGREMPKDVCCKFPLPPRDKLDKGEKNELHECLKSKGTEKRGAPHQPGGRGPPPPPHHRRGSMECFKECIFKISGLLTEDNQLDREAIRKAKESVSNDNDWKSVSEAALTKCFDDPGRVNPNSQCKSGADQFFKCTIREMYMNCPESSWNNSEECQKEKEIITKCPNRLPSPGPRNRRQQLRRYSN